MRRRKTGQQQSSSSSTSTPVTPYVSILKPVAVVSNPVFVSSRKPVLTQPLKVHEPATVKDVKELKVSNYKEKVVSKSLPREQAKFRFRCFSLVATQLLFTALVSSWITMLPRASEHLKSQLWISGIELLLLIFVVFILWKNMFRRFSIPHQVFGLIMTTLILTFAISLVTTYFDTKSFILGLILASCFVYVFAIYSLQSKLGFGKLGMTIFTLCLMLLVSYFVLILPFSNFWSHPIDQWNNKPPDMMVTLLTLLFAVSVTITIIWRIHVYQDQLFPREYLFGTFQMYMTTMALVLFVLKDILMSSITTTSASSKMTTVSSISTKIN